MRFAASFDLVKTVTACSRHQTTNSMNPEFLRFFLSQKFSFVPDLRRRIKIRFGISEIISPHCLRLKFVELHELRGQSIKNMIEASSMPYSIIEILLQAFVVCTINVTQRRRIYHNKTILFLFKFVLKFWYSEKATIFLKKIKMLSWEILSNFVAFSEYLNFI